MMQINKKTGHPTPHLYHSRRGTAAAGSEAHRRKRMSTSWLVVILCTISSLTALVGLRSLTTRTAERHENDERSTLPDELRRWRGLISSSSLLGMGDTFLGNDKELAALQQQQQQYLPPPQMDDPAWWLEDGIDDYFNRTYIKEAGINLQALHYLRSNITSTKSFFNAACGRYRFNHTLMPTVSVIIPIQNERERMLSLTIHSVIARTPPTLLKEIIIVDDNGALPHIRGNHVNDTEFLELQALLPHKIHYVRNENREGCARSRMIGASMATAHVLIFIDSHNEMLSSTWVEHLLIPIIENPHTMALQTLDVISDLTYNYNEHPGSLLYGTVGRTFLFSYQDVRFENKSYAEKPHPRLPYETPFGPGSLFAIRRDEFWRLGGYDKGLYVWGGENTELALKMWMCGGRMVMVPCSRAGHLYRVHIKETGRWPPDIPAELMDRLGLNTPGEYMANNRESDNFNKIVARNNIRVISMWVGDHPAKRAYYETVFGSEKLPPEWQRIEDEMQTDPAALEQLRIKEENKCKDFEWFNRHVFYKLLGKHHPWHPSHPVQKSCGAHFANSCHLCPQGNGAAWCNGDCKWCGVDGTQGECLNKTDVAGCESAKKKKEVDLKAKKEKQHMIQEKKDGLRKAKHVKGDEDDMDKALQTNSTLRMSVILPCGFEHEYFERTAMSVFNSTPSNVLKEIVIVDDASYPPLERIFTGGDPSKYKIRFVRLNEAAGLIGAKHAGAMAAAGDIIVFFDCHVKPDKNYWKPFVDNIDANYRRVVVPVITALDVEKWEEIPGGRHNGGMSKCYLTFDGEFKWTTDDTQNVPVMSGGLLAMSRRWYREAAGYDPTMKGWGGENLDQSLRIWRCGGEIVSASNSFVAHMWRDTHHPAKYKVEPGSPALNIARAMKAHTGHWFNKTLTFPNFRKWQSEESSALDVSGITDSQKGLNCQPFEWYLWRFRYIYRDAGVLPREVFQIESTKASNNTSESLCLQLRDHHWLNGGLPYDSVILRPCTSYNNINYVREGTQWWHLSNRRPDGTCCSGLRVWNTDQCLADLKTNVCTLDSPSGAVLGEDGLLRLRDRKCLSVSYGYGTLEIIEDCSQATKWKRRGIVAPPEFLFLNSTLKAQW